MTIVHILKKIQELVCLLWTLKFKQINYFYASRFSLWLELFPRGISLGRKEEWWRQVYLIKAMSSVAPFPVCSNPGHSYFPSWQIPPGMIVWTEYYPNRNSSSLNPLEKPEPFADPISCLERLCSLPLPILASHHQPQASYPWYSPREESVRSSNFYLWNPT